MECLETCERLGSCVYRQYDAGTCYLCIKNAADVTSEGGLTSTTVQQVETHVKLGVEDVIFTSQSCEGPLANDQVTNFRRTTTTGQRLTGVEFCSEAWRDFGNKICGFHVSFSGIEQERVGCAYNPIWGQFPDFEIADNEVVLQVNTCFALVNDIMIVNTMTIHTNLRHFGPYGTAAAGGCVTHSNTGFELVGFYGKAVAGIDNFGSIFSRC